MKKSKEYKKVLDVFEKNYKLVPLEVFNDPYEILISTLMSARTNDDTTLPAAKRLFKNAPDLKSLSNLTEEEIEKLIYPVGFYKTKAKNIKKLANILLTKFNGKIPNQQKDLLTLPGVGVKTANLTINRAFKKPAIAVDTHVHKITNWLGWVTTNKPEETLLALEKSVPKKYWTEINRLFVSIGREYKTEKKIKEFLKENNLL